MKKGNKGFTLIELLVVIAIIAILSTVVMAGLNSARSKARDAKRLSDIKQLQSALELYFDSCNGYPGNPVPAAGVDIGTGTMTVTSTFGNCTTPLGNFINPFPTNPYPNGANYHYCATTPAGVCALLAAPGAGIIQNAQGYKITFTLENASGGLLPGPHTAYASSTGVGIQ